MDEDRKLLDTVAAQYFNSVKKSFEDTRKYSWKRDIYKILTLLSAIFFLLNIYPVIPDSKNYFLFDFLEKILKFNLDDFSLK